MALVGHRKQLCTSQSGGTSYMTIFSLNDFVLEECCNLAGLVHCLLLVGWLRAVGDWVTSATKVC